MININRTATKFAGVLAVIGDEWTFGDILFRTPEFYLFAGHTGIIGYIGDIIQSDLGNINTMSVSDVVTVIRRLNDDQD